MEHIFVVNGAKVKCKYGGQSGKLMLPICHGKRIYKQGVMTISDCKEENIPCFGTCSSPYGDGKCRNRVLFNQWSPEQTNILLGGEYILSTGCKLGCLDKKGIIEIETSGQEEAMVKLMVKKKKQNLNPENKIGKNLRKKTKGAEDYWTDGFRVRFPDIPFQKEEELDLEKAWNILDAYLRNEMKGKEEEVDEAVHFIRKNCGLEIGTFQTGAYANNKNENKFDDEVIAWVYYWNKIIEKDGSYDYKFFLRPSVVKAMIARESSLGAEITDKNNDAIYKNPSNNVMQSLVTGDATVWIAYGENPFSRCAEDANIIFEMLDGEVRYTGSICQQLKGDYLKANYLETERKKYHFENIHILEDIYQFDEEKKTYRFRFRDVTPRMSIAIGVGLLAVKINYKSYDKNGNLLPSSEYYGVMYYNSNESYAIDVDQLLKEMNEPPLDKTILSK